MTKLDFPSFLCDWFYYIFFIIFIDILFFFVIYGYNIFHIVAAKEMIGIQEIRRLLQEAKLWRISPISWDFLSPSYIIGLASMINGWTYPKHILESLHISEGTKTYLNRCNFTNIINWGDLSPYTWGCNRLTEITLIPWDIDFGPISLMFAKILLQKMEIQEKNKQQKITTAIDRILVLSFAEISNNIIVHSKSDFSKNASMFMMQCYPSTKNVHIACVDNGIWIVESLKRSRHYDEHLDWLWYLRLALAQWITGNPAEWQGNGLYTCSQIIECIQGKLEILSWETFYQQIWQNKIYEYNWSAFPWTLINIEVNLDNMIKYEYKRKEFLWPRYIESTELPVYDTLRE